MIGDAIQPPTIVAARSFVGLGVVSSCRRRSRREFPNGARIVDETWSQFAANGGKLSDAKKPAAMLKVGNAGDVGTVEMQDLILNGKGPTPDVVLMEWNIQAMLRWGMSIFVLEEQSGRSSHRPEYPPNTRGTNSPNFQVASLLLHVSKQASGYFETFWAWVADHQIDDPDLNDIHNNMEQLSVYSARGILIESRKATWLYGTASEHSLYYQYNFHGARNIFTTFLQTESAYYQPTPAPPAPFESAVGNILGTGS
ncbi:hypothetical protein J3458_012270 [Metarhizium acridum]|uniref:uncharacterized protein n=1 Tax=Metarhizium acridum TaxID=92637 RepID=UPI001C6BF207|nr:hypothetical protein J3458_012270 [Metarhizium acridum]